MSKAWHAIETTQALDDLRASPDGLTQQQAQERLQQYGPNQLPETASRSALQRFLLQFHNVLIYVLIAAILVTLLLSHWIDASVIAAVVIINALIGFLQEGKAENALRAIRHMLSPMAIALRDSRQITLAAAKLVPGDIVMLQSGDRVPADLRLLQTRGLLIQEAALTGESVAVEKQTAAVQPNSVIADQSCMAFSGTMVMHGQGKGVVVATGPSTAIGRISTLVAEVDTLSTPLLRQIAQFSRWLTAVIMATAVITLLFGVWFQGYSLAEMFLAAVSLAVAAIPEGLPAIMTITLAIGVQRMARRNAIIRRLPAVETLGSVNIICTDKTGTLTRNEMTLRVITLAQQTFRIEGAGYDPHGSIHPENQAYLSQATDTGYLPILRAALLCNDASLQETDSDWQVSGDPMEAALLIAAMKAGLDVDNERLRFPRTDMIPFESEHRFMATLHHSHEGKTFIYLKGAPEQVIDMCDRQLDAKGQQQHIDRQYWLERIETMAADGQRILAIATRDMAASMTELDFADVESGLTLMGLFGLIDPPRPEAIAAVQSCNTAGIRVKMITGDHAVTARAIARQLHLMNSDAVLTGTELDAMSDEQLSSKAVEVDVFARVSPEHKLRLVKLLQQQQMVVAMTGDGVNDAPALKRADVGTAMGKNGTEAAKEAAAMVLTDDNFASITHAVEEGRTVYDNLRKAIIFILPTSGGEALIIMAAVFFGFHQLPLTPVQILWVNMITTVTLALSLAFEPSEQDVMQLPPRDTSKPILDALLVWRILFVSLVMMSGTFYLFLQYMAAGASIEIARTVAVNTLVMFEIFYLFNSRYISASVLNWRGLSGNRYIVLASIVLVLFQLAFTYLPVSQQLFGTADIDWQEWLLIVAVASSVLFLVELEKLLLRNNRATI